MEATFEMSAHSDIDTLLVLMQEFYAYEHLPFETRSARSALTGLIADPSLGYVWLIYCDLVVAGYVALTRGFSLEYGGPMAVIDELYLRADYRGQGIGPQVLEFVEKACRHLGIQALRLEVGPENTRAQHLYRKAGLEVLNRHLMSKWLFKTG